MDSVSSRMAYEMNLAGSDPFDIAEALHCTVDEAITLINEWGDSIPSPTNVEARRDEIKRVDKWHSRLEVEYRDKTIPIDRAITAFVKLSQRRSELMGLNAPTKQEIEAVINAAPPSSVDAELEALANELGLGRKYE